MTRPSIPEAALYQHIAIVGKTGSGKTSTAKLAIEQVVRDGMRVCVLDPIKSDWWGMISSADGRRPGLPFNVLGGPRGHVPLHSGAGSAIAELVASGRLPLSILDMAEFEPGGQSRFFIDFADTLIKRMRGVLYLVIEEAHEFAPKERAGFSDENKSIHFAKKLATAGRSKGIRLVVLTQRTQALHNAMLGSCDTLIAHRMTAPADQDPIVKWLKANTTKEIREQVAESLAALKTGHGWICSGEAKVFERVHFPRISTFDNTATPEGDGEDVRVKGADVDLVALRSLVGEAVQQAEADDPKKLKARIAELERKLLSATSTPVVGNVNEQLEARVIALEHDSLALARHRDAFADQNKVLRERISKLERAIDDGKSSLRDATHALQSISAEILPDPPAYQKPSTPATSSASHVPASTTSNGSGGDPSLGKGERAVLLAIAQYPDGCDQSQIAVLTGYKETSRKVYARKLRSAGYLTPGWPAKATPAGIAALGSDFEPLPRGRALRGYWIDRLSGGELTLFNVICNAYPNGLTGTELQNAADYEETSRKVYVRRLVARKIIERREHKIFASRMLFE